MEADIGNASHGKLMHRFPSTRLITVFSLSSLDIASTQRIHSRWVVYYSACCIFIASYTEFSWPESFLRLETGLHY